MGIFSKIKEIFKKGNQEENKVEEASVENNTDTQTDGEKSQK